MKQPANKPDQLVQFRLSDAQRIANAVSQIESTRRKPSKSSLPRAAGGGGGGIVMATFTGSWLKRTPKVVTISGAQTSTAQCSNFIVDILFSNSTRTCFITTDTLGEYTLLIPECIR